MSTNEKKTTIVLELTEREAVALDNMLAILDHLQLFPKDIKLIKKSLTEGLRDLRLEIASALEDVLGYIECPVCVRKDQEYRS